MKHYYVGAHRNYYDQVRPPNSLSSFDWFRKKSGNIVLDAGWHLIVEESGKMGVKSHFLDSGAFTLKSKAEKYAQKNQSDQWSWYRSKEMKSYLDDYVKFVLEHQAGIDLYANVDVMGNPELTWKNQQYLEKKGLKPVPVVHYKSDLKWLSHYLELGYDPIGLGGLVGSMVKSDCIVWLDKCFDLVCNTKDKLPSVKLHGFGVSRHKLMIKYPWWSVDSSSWTKICAFGGIIIPFKGSKGFVFNDETKPPYIMKVSQESTKVNIEGSHLLTLRGLRKDILLEWLNEIDIPIGEVDEEGKEIVPGVLTQYIYRAKANVLYYEKMASSLPEWPWPFKGSTRAKGFNF